MELGHGGAVVMGAREGFKWGSDAVQGNTGSQSTLALQGKEGEARGRERGAGCCSESAPSRKNPGPRWCPGKGEQWVSLRSFQDVASVDWMWGRGVTSPEMTFRPASGAILCVLYPQAFA